MASKWRSAASANLTCLTPLAASDVTVVSVRVSSTSAKYCDNDRRLRNSATLSALAIERLSGSW